MKSMKLFAFSGWAYVLFWVIGLILEPGSPGLSSSAVEISSYYLSHKDVHMIQAYLIDGIAAFALLLFISTLGVFFYHRHKSDLIILVSMYSFGLIAASVSLIQAGFQQILSGTVLINGGISPNFILSIISYLDTFKLHTLALFVLLVSILAFQSKSFQPWIWWMGGVLSIFLFVGGFSFLTFSSILNIVLYFSLPVLLIWVASVSTGLIRSQLPVSTNG
jgi:hypothetical protein